MAASLATLSEFSATAPDVPLVRPMFFYERFLFVSGLETWNVFIAIRLRGRLESASLRAALGKLQRRHPPLRAGVEVRNGRPWFVTVREPLPLVVSVREDDTSWLREAWQARREPFPPGGPLARLLWIRSAPGNEPDELVFGFHHCICDGVSAVLLVREFLYHLAAPAGPVTSHPALMSLAELQPGRPPSGARGRLRDTGVVAASRLLLPATRLLRRPTPGADHLVRWELDPPTLSSLDRRCRLERATMTFVLSAAVLLAFRDVRGGAARNRLLCPVDLRPLLPGIGRDQLFPIADAVMLSLDHAGTSLWDHAKLLREQLVDGKAKLDPGRRLLVAERLHAVADRLVELQRFGRVKQDAVISVLPPLNFPSGEGAATVLDVLGAFGVIPWRDATAVYVFRDHGRMVFILVSRQDLLDGEDAKRIGDRVGAILSGVSAAR